MGFNLTPGRGNFAKTGNSIPDDIANKSIDPKLQEAANKKAEAMRAKAGANLSTGQRRDFTATASDITPAKTPEEVAKWKQAIGKPGAGRLIQKASATVSDYGKIPLKPAGLTSGNNGPSAPLPKITPKTTTPKPNDNLTWTKGTVANNVIGTATSTGLTRNPKEIAAGNRKQAIDTAIPERPNAATASGKNTYQTQEMSPRESKLYNRGLIGSKDNPIGVNPQRYESFLTAKENIATRQDVTLAERAKNRETAKTARLKAIKK